jgi:glycosyltransferase involved in cell wall biosynthesis
MTVAGPLLQAGIPIHTMNMRPGVPDPRGVVRLACHLRRLRPDVIQTWMDHSNLIGGLAAWMAGRIPVVWGVHHAHHVQGVAKRSTLWTVSACALLSRRLAERIVCCSEQGRMLYRRQGFAEDVLTVIPNGFDTRLFRPDVQARASLRVELGLDPEAPLIGLAARFDPNKDHATFVRAAAALAAIRPDVHFVLCGSGVDRGNVTLASQIDAHGISRRVHLLGPRRDMPCVHAALDVATSSSISEAFPLAIGEAMACGVPCVATDVGDSALIVGPTGRIVPAGDSDALARAWDELLAMEPAALRRLGLTARERIRASFDLDDVARRYQDLHEQVARPHAQPRRATRPSPSPRGRSLKVLMIVESSAGGTGRHVLDLCEGLIARGCEIHLLYSTGRIDRLFLERLGGLTGLRHAPLPMRRGMHPGDVGVVRAVRRYLRRHGPFDVIHGHSSKGGAVARLAALGGAVPAIYTLHGLIMMDPGLSALKRLLYLGIELCLSLRTSRIIAVSPEESRAARRVGLGRSRVLTIPNGVDARGLAPRARARQLLGAGADDLVIGFVGRLVEQKAPDVLLRAFARALSTVPRARLAVVGGGPMEAGLRDLANTLGVAGQVTWLGERDARQVLAGFDALAISSRKEGLPYVVLEAMGAGLPVIATAASGVELLVQTGVNGVVVRAGDVTGLARAIADLARDADRRLAFGRASRERASRFTIDAMVERTLAAYRSVARPARSAAAAAAAVPARASTVPSRSASLVQSPSPGEAMLVGVPA